MLFRKANLETASSSLNRVVVDVEVGDEPVLLGFLRVVPHVFEQEIEARLAQSLRLIGSRVSVVVTFRNAEVSSKKVVEGRVDFKAASAESEPVEEGVVVNPSPLPPEAEVVHKLEPGSPELGEGIDTAGKHAEAEEQGEHGPRGRLVFFLHFYQLYLHTVQMP